MVTKATPKTRQQKIDERHAEIGAIQQMELRREAEHVEWQREHDEFAQRAEAAHDAIDTHIRRSWAQREDRPMSAQEFYQAKADIQEAAFAQIKKEIPTLDQISRAAREQELASEAEAERQRIANLTPREVWMSTLIGHDRQRVLTWEGINRQKYPVPGLE